MRARNAPTGGFFFSRTGVRRIHRRNVAIRGELAAEEDVASRVASWDQHRCRLGSTIITRWRTSEEPCAPGARRPRGGGIVDGPNELRMWSIGPWWRGLQVATGD